MIKLSKIIFISYCKSKVFKESTLNFSQIASENSFVQFVDQIF